MLPSASPGSRRFCRSSGPAAASTALVITVGTNGPGARYRPICSATTSVSGSPKPEQAEAAQLGPEDGQRVRFGREQAAGRCARLMVGEEVGDGLREGAVFFRD